jgi:transcription antitermination factor NusG
VAALYKKLENIIMTTQSAKLKWFVIYTRPNHEKVLAQEISQLQSCESYLPVKKIMRKWSDRVKKIEVPLFSNYVFVKSTNESRTLLFNMPGIIRFVSFEGKPVTISDNEIARIKLIESNSASIENESYHCAGKEVTISRGIFAGITGTVIKKINESRFVIRVPLLMQAVSVHISDEDIIF